MEQTNVITRRKATRFDASAIPFLKGVYLGEGPEIKLINISRGGALIETQERISPGTSVSLRIVTKNSAHIVEGQILRCNAISIGKVSVCQCAIAFNRDFTILPPSQEIY